MECKRGKGRPGRPAELLRSACLKVSRRTPAPSGRDSGRQRRGHAMGPEPDTRNVLSPPTAAETTLEAGLLASSREVNFPVRCLPVRLSMHSGELRSDLMRLRRIGRGASLVTVAGAAPEFAVQRQHRLPVSSRTRDKLAERDTSSNENPGDPRDTDKYTECEGERVGNRTRLQFRRRKPKKHSRAEAQRCRDKAFRTLENQKSRTLSTRKKPSRLERLGSRVRCACPGYN